MTTQLTYLEWRAATSYSQSDRLAKIAPRTWELGATKIMVTKHVLYGEEWTVLAPTLKITSNEGLGTNDADEAKRITVELCLARCQKQIDELAALYSALSALSSRGP